MRQHNPIPYRHVLLYFALSLCACTHAQPFAWLHKSTHKSNTQKSSSGVLPKLYQKNANKNEAFRQKPPASGMVAPFRAPMAKKAVLSNGMVLWVVEKSDLPLIHFEIVFRHGSANDPEKHEGLAYITAEMIKMGSKKYNAQRVASIIENAGSALHKEVDEHTSSFEFFALDKNVEQILPVFADVIMHPEFSYKEINWVKNRSLAHLLQIQDDPDYLANKIFHETLYPKHPYAHLPLGERKAVANITRQQIQDFYQRYYRPDAAACIVVGNISLDEAKKALETYFGHWRTHSKQKPVYTIPEPATPNLHKVVLYDRPNSAQSQIILGQLGVKRNHPDYYALVLANAILGGTFNSRINMNLREDKGYTYGAHSHFDFQQQAGPFYISTSVRTDATALAVTEVFKEIEKIKTQGVTEEELKFAKNFYTLSLAGKFETVGQIANRMGELFTFDLPENFYQELPEKLEQVSVQDIHRVLNAYLNTQNMVLVVVGDAANITLGLSQLNYGAIETYTLLQEKEKQHHLSHPRPKSNRSHPKHHQPAAKKKTHPKPAKKTGGHPKKAKK
jgi:zinc protease